MTPQELAALVELLNRCPMTAAERQWMQMVINRLVAEGEAKNAKPLPRPSGDGGLTASEKADLVQKHLANV